LLVTSLVVKSTFTPRNLIIRSLSEDGSKTFLSKLQRVQIDRNAVLYEVGTPIKWIYFPEDSVITFLGDTGQGGQIEVWSVGAEGVAGGLGVIDGFFPYRGVVSVSGHAVIADVDTFRKSMQKNRELNSAVWRYCQRLIIQVAQIGLCNSAHDVEQRFCRWLLMMQQRTGSQTLTFTQDFIAGILDTRRASISVAASSLQNSGLIRYTTGSITILSRRRLLAAACACYQRLEYSRLNRKNRGKTESDDGE
jgi:CRP-like cAMP-binding protein